MLPPTARRLPALRAAAPAAKKVDFGIIKEGMSQAEVDSLIGQPTAQTQHMTGKQWQPFNFGAKDLQRLYYLYKGVGPHRVLDEVRIRGRVPRHQDHAGSGRDGISVAAAF